MIFNIQIDNGVNTKDGTATAGDILNGKIAYVGKEKIVGSMKDNGDVDSAIVNGVLQEGYTSGGAIQNLSEENIRDGVVIAGKTGSYVDIPSTPSTEVVLIPTNEMTYITSLNHKLTFVSWKSGGHQIVTFIFSQSTMLLVHSVRFKGYDQTTDPKKIETFQSFPFKLLTSYDNSKYRTVDGEIRDGNLYLSMTSSGSAEKFTVCHVD